MAAATIEQAHFIHNHREAIEAEGNYGTQQVVMVLGEEKVHTEKKKWKGKIKNERPTIIDFNHT